MPECEGSTAIVAVVFKLQTRTVRSQLPDARSRLSKLTARSDTSPEWPRSVANKRPELQFQILMRLSSAPCKSTPTFSNLITLKHYSIEMLNLWGVPWWRGRQCDRTQYSRRRSGDQALFGLEWRERKFEEDRGGATWKRRSTLERWELSLQQKHIRRMSRLKMEIFTVKSHQCLACVSWTVLWAVVDIASTSEYEATIL